MTVNEELTAEEWKRRYERERDKVGRLRAQLDRMQAELSRWRNGETVSAEEQVNLKEAIQEANAATPGGVGDVAPGAFPNGDSLLITFFRIELFEFSNMSLREHGSKDEAKRAMSKILKAADVLRVIQLILESCILYRIYCVSFC